MKPVVVAKIQQEALRASWNFADDHWLHHPMNVKETKFNSYIYTLFLDHFCVLIVMIRCKLYKIHGVEKLLNNVFGHNVERPSS